MRTGELYQRYYGMYVARVVSTDDPEKLGRVRLEADQYEDAADEVVWASVARPLAGDGSTVFFTPKAGDQVVIGYMVGDVNEPLVLGYAHSRLRKPPDTVSENVHGVVIRGVGRVLFDEDKKAVEVVFDGLGPALESSIRMDATGVKVKGPVVQVEAKVMLNLAAPVINFAGSPQFGAVLPPVPTNLSAPPAPPPVPTFDFSEQGLNIKTSGKKLAIDSKTVAVKSTSFALDTATFAVKSPGFCVNGKGVVLVDFVTKVFEKHVHVSSGTVPTPPVVPVPNQVTKCSP